MFLPHPLCEFDVCTPVLPVSSHHRPHQFKSSVPAPSRMFGREAELEAIVRILLNFDRPRLAILGPGGMGKTTLALTAMHNTDIKKKYNFRHFVSCEACIALESLLSEFSDALEIPSEDRDAKLLNKVIDRLDQSNPILLCLDNFETPWFESSSKQSFEDFLRRLDFLPNLAVLITMRGEERPSGLAWSRPLLPPLTRLPASSMLEVLDHAASGQVNLQDADVKQLMNEIDGLPLAATLLGHLLRDGIETPESLQRRWSKENTKMLETSENHRLDRAWLYTTSITVLGSRNKISRKLQIILPQRQKEKKHAKNNVLDALQRGQPATARGNSEQNATNARN